jgi:hypothetical protein
MYFPTFLPNCNQISAFSSDCHKVPNIKFHENLPSGSHADKSRWMDRRDEGNRGFCNYMIATNTGRIHVRMHESWIDS